MKKAWIISVDMGYGHQRTAYSLENLALTQKIINANYYQGIPENDKKIWKTIRKFYESISRFSRIPFIGKSFFSIYDQFQKILTFYPKRDLSKPNLAIKQIFSLIKRGWGKHLIEKLKTQNLKLKTDLPIVSTFFISAFMAEFFNYPGEIFCVICDADISRNWVSLNPQESKIKYFVPTERVAERLRFYKVKPENIFLTGYPLPLENIGSENLEILKEDLKYRLLNLDPQRKYFEKYKVLIEGKLGKLPNKSNYPFTIMFSVGGAGAQKEIGIEILKSLKEKIQKGEVKIILSVGIREKVKIYFEENIKKLNLQEFYNDSIDVSVGQSADMESKGITIIFDKEIKGYFQKFNFALRKTSILWTKPSELSFYSALGIPIIIAPAIGSHEEFNKRWLLKSGFGLFQENPKYVSQWLFDWLEKGYLAEMAIEAFVEGEKFGTLNIKRIISSL